jgi:lysophospholipase L1-like esterase
MKKRTFISIFLMVTISIVSSAQKAKPTVFTIGDSTVQIWDSVNYPKTGWGQLLNFFFNTDSVKISDKGIGGTSSVTYYNSYWAGVKSNIKAGDFVLIQFGINDGFQTIDPSTTFKDYLSKFVTESQAIGAIPVLMTPMNNNNLTNGSWRTYPDAVRQLATSLNIPIIDLDATSKALFNSVGYNYATNFIFMNLAPGDYTTYPTGNVDNTHFQEMGAIEMAKLVVQGVKNLSSDINVKTLIPYLNPTYKVTFNSNNSVLGTITRSEYFPAGIRVTAKAMANSYGKFNSWTGDISATTPIDTFIMGKADKIINANFTSLIAQNKLLNGNFADWSTQQVSCNKGLVSLVYPTNWAFNGQYKGVTQWGDIIFKSKAGASPSGNVDVEIGGYATAYTDTMFQMVTLTAGKYSFSGAFRGGSIGTASVNLIINKVGESTNLLKTSIPDLTGFNGSSFITYTTDLIIPSDGIYRIAVSSTNPNGGWIWLQLADFTFGKSKPTVHTIGDSTVSTWATTSYPKAGWGQELSFFLNQDSIAIDNKAVSGASSLTFYNTFWTSIKSNIKAGDYLFIQFGINDGALDPSTTFKDYLTKYITETQALGAFPVLITPMNNNNLPNGSWGLYPDAIRQLATSLSVPLIDLDALSKAMLASVGNIYSTNFIFLNLAAGDYSNYPNGNVDNTHFQEMGAIEIAKLVVQGIKNLSIDVNVMKLIPSINPTYKVNFTSNNSLLGTITRSEYFPAGINVTAKALPTVGAKFDGWSGDLIDTKAISSFVMGATQITINASFSPISAITDIENNSVIFFPNPVYDGKLHIKTSLMNSSNIQVSITNLVGKVIFSKSVGNANQIINLSDLSKGVYILTLETNESKKSQKLFFL